MRLLLNNNESHQSLLCSPSNKLQCLTSNFKIIFVL